jgi:cytidyltransferase-like protein
MLIAIAGGFDPIHPGHIDHIQKAAALKGPGDQLIVIMATEDQLRLKKGWTFYGSFHDRVRIVQAIKGVDRVYPNLDRDVTTCAETLRMIRPGIFCKGGDRTPNNMPACEIEACADIGCRIEYGIGGHIGSSTNLVLEAIHNVKRAIEHRSVLTPSR